MEEKINDDMRFIFVLFAIFGHQVLLAQDVKDKKVSICGFFLEIYDKEEITDYYVNQYKRFVEADTYSTAIDLRKNIHIIISEKDGNLLFEDILNETLRDRPSNKNSDTVYIYPELSNKYLYKKCGFELPSLGKIDYIKKCALSFSPLYAPYNNNIMFKCFYFKGTAFYQKIDEIDKKWKSSLLDSHAIGNMKKKKSVLVVDDIHTYTPYILLEHLPIWLPSNSQQIAKPHSRGEN